LKKIYFIIIILSISLVFCVKFLAEENDLKLDTFEGSLNKVGEEWFLNTGKGLFKLVLAPEEYLVNNNIEIHPQDSIKVIGLLEKEEIIIYQLNYKDIKLDLRDEDGLSLWEEEVELSQGQYVVIPSQCIGCRLCVSNCPVNAISMRKGVAYIDPQKCISCGICINGNRANFKGCPVGAIKINN